MKFSCFRVQCPTGPVGRVGLKVGDKLIDVTAAYATVLDRDGQANPESKAASLVPPNVIKILENGEEALEAAKRVLSAEFEKDERSPRGSQIIYPIENVRITSPIRKPNSIRDCITFEEHMRNALDGEIPDPWYEFPVYYKSTTDNIYGPGDTIHWPNYSDEADYELELAAVIGKQGIDISADEAENYIAGFTIFNDFSARDIQMREMEVGLGPSKGKDFANAFGPYLAHCSN